MLKLSILEWIEQLHEKDKKFGEITELLEKLSFYVELEMLIDP